MGDLSPSEEVGEAELVEERYTWSGARDTEVRFAFTTGNGNRCSLVGGLVGDRPLTDVKAGAKDSTFFSGNPYGLELKDGMCSTVDIIQGVFVANFSYSLLDVERRFHRLVTRRAGFPFVPQCSSVLITGC